MSESAGCRVGLLDASGRFRVVDVTKRVGGDSSLSLGLLQELVGGDITAMPFTSPAGALTAYSRADGVDDPGLVPNTVAAERFPSLGLRLYPEGLVGPFVFARLDEAFAEVGLEDAHIAALAAVLSPGREPEVEVWD